MHWHCGRRRSASCLRWAPCENRHGQMPRLPAEAEGGGGDVCGGVEEAVLAGDWAKNGVTKDAQ